MPQFQPEPQSAPPAPAPPAMFRTEMRASVLLAVLDMPGRPVNVFSWGLMDQLEALIDRVERDDRIQAVVITSGKASFLAGADLDMVRGFATAGRTAGRAHLHDMCGRLGRLFVRLEALDKPWVAAVNGLALGGGLELSMACHARLAADSPRVQLGLPEIRLGLLPGAGGTQRLPRLIGIARGMELLLNGKSLSAADAAAAGLMDELVPPERLVERAIEVAQGLAGKPPPSRLPVRLDPGPFDTTAPDAVRRITRHYGYPDAVTAAYPAYDAIVRAVLEGADLPMREGGEVEMERFVDLMQNEVAGNMVTTLFLERQKADKLVQQFSGMVGARFAVAPGRGAEELRAALVAAKATVVEPDQAGAGDVVMVPVDAPATVPADLHILAAADDRVTGGIGVHVRCSPGYGTAIEIMAAGGGKPGLDKALALARQLRATPYVHSGARSLLATLADIERLAVATGVPEAAMLAAQAVAAAAFKAEGDVGNPAAADVACVVGGVFPAHAGGPFTHLARLGAAGDGATP